MRCLKVMWAGTGNKNFYVASSVSLLKYLSRKSIISLATWNLDLPLPYLLTIPINWIYSAEYIKVWLFQSINSLPIIAFGTSCRAPIVIRHWVSECYSRRLDVQIERQVVYRLSFSFVFIFELTFLTVRTPNKGFGVPD